MGDEKRGSSGNTVLLVVGIVAVVLLIPCCGVVGVVALMGNGFYTIQAASQVDSAKTQIGRFETAIEQYRLEVGKYPSGDQGLEALRVQPPDAPANTWHGPYIENEIPKDPWGNSYQYRVITDSLNQPSFEITSLGQDGVAGTVDDIRLPK
jgi:general secretion pathway protein G